MEKLLAGDFFLAPFQITESTTLESLRFDANIGYIRAMLFYYSLNFYKKGTEY